MKKCVWTLLILCLPCFLNAQKYEAEQLLLDVEKLSQLKQMLSNMKSGYEIIHKGYSSIKNLSKGNFSLHQAFLNGLLEVSPAIKNYKKIALIISLQLQLVSEYKSACKAFMQNGKFTSAEVRYMSKVYSHLINESVNNLQTLTLTTTPGTLRMNDGERLQQIDALYEDMVSKLAFLRHFNDQAFVLSELRANEKNDIIIGEKLHGLNN